MLILIEETACMAGNRKTLQAGDTRILIDQLAFSSEAKTSMVVNGTLI